MATDTSVIMAHAFLLVIRRIKKLLLFDVLPAMHHTPCVKCFDTGHGLSGIDLWQRTSANYCCLSVCNCSLFVDCINTRLALSDTISTLFAVRASSLSRILRTSHLCKYLLVRCQNSCVHPKSCFPPWPAPFLVGVPTWIVICVYAQENKFVQAIYLLRTCLASPRSWWAYIDASLHHVWTLIEDVWRCKCTSVMHRIHRD